MMRNAIRPLCGTLALVAMLALVGPVPAEANSAKDGATSFDPRTMVATIPYVTVSVIRGGQTKGVLTVGLGLELESAEMAPKVDHIIPRLQDAYFIATTQFGQQVANIRAPIDVTALTATLQAVTDKELGAGKAKVLISYAALMRR